MVVGSLVPVATGNGRVALVATENSVATAPRRRVLPLDRKRRRGNGRAGARPSRVATYPPNEVSRASGRKRGAPSRRVPYGAFPLCDGEGAIATGGSRSRSTKNGVGPADAQERVPPEHGVAKPAYVSRIWSQQVAANLCLLKSSA